jgi:cytidine deaminase
MGPPPAPGRASEVGEHLLFSEARRTAERAYAPYSSLAVGAVAVGPSGRLHRGVNVENASYPAGLCAERAALAAMVVDGELRARYVAVAARDGRDLAPCGMCLQAMAELGEPEVIARVGGEVRVLSLRDLLPAPFTAAGLAGEPEAGDGEAATAGSAPDSAQGSPGSGRRR